MLEFVEFVFEIVLAGVCIIGITHAINSLDKVSDDSFKLNDVQNSFEEKVRFH